MFASKDIFLKSSGGYQISRSVRLRSSASAYLNRTLTTPTNNLKWTWSAWIKRGTLSVANVPFGAGDGSSNNFGNLQFTTSNTLQFAQINGGAYNVQMVTSAVFRDPAAWYHIQVVYDSANATSTDRVQIYVNGVRQSVTYSTGPFAQNTASKINSAIAHYISKLDYTTVYFDGYQTEVNFIDGQALTPSSFGETNPITGVWQPKRYAGTYGTNGFYLNFSDNSNNTAATIGKDWSGNGNNWTPNNISVTTGSTYDSMIDVPTLYADGGNGRGNYATLNPLDNGGNTVSSGNLVITTATGFDLIRSTMFVSSGKWYWEVTCDDCGEGFVGVSAATEGLGTRGAETTNSATIRTTNGDLRTNATNTAYGSAVSDGNVMMFALDMDAGKFWAGKGGTWFNSGDPAAGTNAGKSSGLTVPVSPSISTYDNEDYTANFGQRPFAYTPPSGFKALNTQNLPAPTISNGASYMAATTYTGTGASQTISNAVNSISFQPDFVWVKGRSGATDHALYDAVRGVQNQLESNTTTAETTETTGLTAFGTTGFTIGALAQMNTSAATYVGWQWKEGPTQGFDIVTYTGNGGTQNISHNLGVVPNMIIVKSRSAAQRWTVYHSSIPNSYIYLNETFAADTANAALRFGNNSAVVQPTSSVFTIGNSVDVNQNTTTYVAYLFSEVAGYSKFGSYTGNGSADGPFVYLGFRPRFIMFKKSSAAEDWVIFDTTRNASNLTNLQLYPNLSAVEATGVAGVIDILSNGFKIRGTSDALNTNGGTYIFMAVAENPFKLSLAR